MLETVLELLAAKQISREAARRLVDAARGAPAEPARPANLPVAVVGVAAQLPGADTYERFWDVLVAGEDRVATPPPARRRLCAPLVGAEAVADQTYDTGGWLDDVDLFDAEFFGVSPADARTMDPQQRRFLRVAYHCLEDAGWAGRVRGTRTGVYVAAAGGDYSRVAVPSSPSDVPGSVASFTASRLSFLLDLRGPAYVASATCASSLVALHDAVRGLAAGDCDLAVVGGVTIFSFPVHAPERRLDASGIMADDGRCRPFDETAAGIGRGEGVAALLLRPLADALRDRDRIRGVILASAVNNDGAGAALTAPNPAAHTDLLDDAWRRAGISPESLAYLETHGTGTALGDPIEIRGITDAVRRHTARRQFIAAGSVKGNVGHLLDGMAGLSGLLKALLVLEHRCVPPTVHLREPSSRIDFTGSPVFVPSRPWDLRPSAPRDSPLRAGVSCFGFGGTNVHVVVEEPPPRPPAPPHDEPALVFPLSARGPEPLRRLLSAHALGHNGAPAAQDIAYTLWAGRDHFAHRVAIVARTREEFTDQCRRLTGGSGPAVAGVALADGVPEGPASAMARDYVSGADVPWRTLFAATTPSVVSLPLYPFEERSFWIGAAGTNGPGGGDVPASVLSIVAECLGVAELSPGDSFVGLGGSSLSAMKVQVEVRRRLGREIGVDELLGADTFAELAVAIGAGEASA